jgi:hypothetical protein
VAGAVPVLDQKARATLLALVCSNFARGADCWTMQLLADALVERRMVGAMSDETVRRVLKRNRLAPWLRERW